MTRKLIQPCHLSASRQPFCLCMAKLQFVALARHASIPSRRSFFLCAMRIVWRFPFVHQMYISLLVALLLRQPEQ